MARTTYSTLKDTSSGLNWLSGIFAIIVLMGLASFWYMEHYGHIVTGMSNKIIWGMPHVFAIFLIIAASGALNVASIASVFDRKDYKPLARLSTLLALALLAGGLFVLVLDLGRPDRLIVAMTTYNFKSIFAWNIFLYTGFMAIVLAYLYTMMAKNMGRYSSPIGRLAFVWRLVLTAGTGSIFGFIVARNSFDSAMIAPLFIASSLVYGLAFTILTLALVGSPDKTPLLGPDLIKRFGRLLLVFSATVLFLTILFHLTKLYVTANHEFERFMLSGANIYSQVFWGGQILLGLLVPIYLLFVWRKSITFAKLTLCAVLTLLGGIAQLYVIVIGGQAFPIDLFPGMEVSSTFQDGEIVSYSPSLPETLLGLAGLSIAMLLCGILVRIMPILPVNKTV